MLTARHMLYASSEVSGWVPGSKVSLKSVAIELLKSPMTCSLKAAVLLVPSVMLASLINWSL